MSIILFEQICRQLDLGALTESPVSLTGGFMHKMYSLRTVKGNYAVKLLNPYILKRDSAMDNYRTAEELELQLESCHIPILPALRFHGEKMQNIDGQYFYLYNWYDGTALKNEEIAQTHCNTIGKILARIHGIDRHKHPFSPAEIQIDWDNYIAQMSSLNTALYPLLLQNRSILYDSQEKGNLAIKKLPPIVSICHNDMDRKNVLWKQTDCRIIDLECLSYSSPYIELYETALCWSGYETCTMNYELLHKFITSYATAGGQLPLDWEIIYDSNFGRLEWLAFNLNRVLGIECSPEEQEMGL